MGAWRFVRLVVNMAVLAKNYSKGIRVVYYIKEIFFLCATSWFRLAKP